jgi:hypothetical protein
LLATNWNGHSLRRLIDTGRVQGKIFNDYILRRNLPDEHQAIRALFNDPSVRHA